MFVGHYAVALAAKRAAPAVSLGALVLAAMLADLLWCVFMLAGIEHVRFQPGHGAANYLVASDIAFSHSLLMNALWAGLLAVAYFVARRSPRAAWLLFAVALSHWLLDWIAHRPDMPLAPAVQHRFGLGLWTSVSATLLVEGGFWLVALVLYARATRPRSRASTFALWIVAAILTLLWYNNIAGPPPPDPHSAPVASLVLFSLSVAWAFWLDRRRPPVTVA